MKMAGKRSLNNLNCHSHRLRKEILCTSQPKEHLAHFQNGPKALTLTDKSNLLVVAVLVGFVYFRFRGLPRILAWRSPSTTPNFVSLGSGSRIQLGTSSRVGI